MACLNLSNGAFSALSWSNAASFNNGGVTIARTAPNLGMGIAGSITVQRAGVAGALNLNGDIRYAVFGASQFIALMVFDSGVGPVNRTVYIVKTVGNNLQTEQVHLQPSVPGSVNLPDISQSPGSGSLMFVWSATGTVGSVNTMSIVRSDNGVDLLNRLGPSAITGNLHADITSTQLVITHPGAGTGTSSAPRPTGTLGATPSSLAFGEAVLGASNPALGTITRNIVLRNNGTDCITVNSIAPNGAYALSPASAALLPRLLDVNETVSLDVVFAPGAAGTFNTTLTVVRTPAEGTSSIGCTGTARVAVARINTSTAAINFGAVPHPGTRVQNVNVQNTGDLNLAISIAPPPLGSSFTWAPVAGLALNVGATTPVAVTFTTPGDFAAAQVTLSVTATLGAATRTVTLDGRGCVANAVITTPPIAPMTFGQIERGFRTVRFITLRNDGDGDLTFRARITPGVNPADAALFGLVLPDNDITDAPDNRPYTVLPTTRCGAGPTGLNTVPVAVSFFADAPPGNFSANLTIDLHNATNAPAAQTWVFALTAEVIPPVPVDAVLVLDRSGSMADPVGARNKSQASLSAARLFVQMLRDNADDRAAIVRFNNNPDLVQALVPIAGNRALLEAAVAPANFVPIEGTNIGGGIIVGEIEAVKAHPSNPPVLKKAMIVLTDGMENVCFQRGGAGAWFSVTGRDTPDMYRPDYTPQDSDPLVPTPGIKIYGIGLGNPAQIDGAALNQLSTATGARYEGVTDLSGDDYFKLEKYFTQIFMETAGLAQITDPFYTIQPGDKHTHEFDILPGDVNAMVVIYDMPNMRLPFFMVSPASEVLSGNSLPPGFSLRYHSTDTARFAEFFFPNKDPARYVGRWQVVVMHEKRVCTGSINGQGEDAKDVQQGFLPAKCREFDKPVNYGICIGAGSNLRMQPFVEPGTKYIGDTLLLSAIVSEAGLPVKNSHVMVTITSPSHQVSVLPLLDDGTHLDGIADDGEYANTFIKLYEAGVYTLKFHAEGLQGNKPYAREAEHTKTVYDKRTPPKPERDPREGGPGHEQPPKRGCWLCERICRWWQKLFVSKVYGTRQTDQIVR